jgi:hypothetical protein
MVSDINRESLANLYAALRVRAIGSKPLASIRVMCKNVIALRGFEDRALRVDRSLIDPIMKLKSECPEM